METSARPTPLLTVPETAAWSLRSCQCKPHHYTPSYAGGIVQLLPLGSRPALGRTWGDCSTVTTDWSSYSSMAGAGGAEGQRATHVGGSEAMQLLGGVGPPVRGAAGPVMRGGGEVREEGGRGSLGPWQRVQWSASQRQLRLLVFRVSFLPQQNIIQAHCGVDSTYNYIDYTLNSLQL